MSNNKEIQDDEYPIPVKSIINPLTKRKIKINGDVYCRLWKRRRLTEIWRHDLAAVELDSSVWKALYTFGAETHDLWRCLIANSGYSMFPTLRRINKHTQSLIDKDIYNWIRYDFGVFKRMSPFYHHIWNIYVYYLERKHSRISPHFFEYALKMCVDDEMKLGYAYSTEIASGLRNKVIDIQKFLKSILIYLTDICTLEYYYTEGWILHLRQKFFNLEAPEDAIIVDLTKDSTRVIFLETELVENGKPIYIALGKERVDVTRYFPEYFKRSVKRQEE